MTDALYDRDFVLIANDQRIAMRPEDDANAVKIMQRVAFTVSRSTDSSANSASVSIWNLNKEHRSQLEEKQPLVIEAGYTGTRQQIFSGDITLVNSLHEGPDWITTLESGDGSEAMSAARINLSFKSGVKIEKVLESVAKAMGVGLGNAIEKFTAGGFRGGIEKFTQGLTIKGRAKQQLDKFMKSAGFNWSIQDGELQVLKPDETMPRTAVYLSNENNGLIGSPELGDKGIVRARCLLRGNLQPGYLVKIKSTQIDNGLFKITSLTHSGDSMGTDWYTDIEGKPIE
ncbi:MAG: hypothetical protein GY841_21255 [FCB group bacterium]|nr:hypothetical protein [FCB group bacterium]